MLLLHLVEWEAEGCYKDEGRKVLIKRLAGHKKTEDYKKVFDFCKEIAQQQSYDVFGIGSKVINFNGKDFQICVSHGSLPFNCAAIFEFLEGGGV